ncbi:hypothetical protein ACWFR1_13255 [Streptomyces sp. NPDC055103]
MGEQWIALVVAAVGVVGTLGAALLTQSRADRSKRLELGAAAEQQRVERRHAEAVRVAERAEQRLRERIEMRRGCYITLNTAARHYLTAQVNLSYALRGRGDTQTCLQELEERRITFRAGYAEAQMIVPDAVLSEVGGASRWLNGGYGTLKRIVAAGADPAARSELASFGEYLDAGWALLATMRGAMRHDLAIDDEEDEDGEDDEDGDDQSPSVP